MESDSRRSDILREEYIHMRLLKEFRHASKKPLVSTKFASRRSPSEVEFYENVDKLAKDLRITNSVEDMSSFYSKKQTPEPEQILQQINSDKFEPHVMRDPNVARPSSILSNQLSSLKNMIDDLENDIEQLSNFKVRLVKTALDVNELSEAVEFLKGISRRHNRSACHNLTYPEQAKQMLMIMSGQTPQNEEISIPQEILEKYHL